MLLHDSTMSTIYFVHILTIILLQTHYLVLSKSVIFALFFSQLCEVDFYLFTWAVFLSKRVLNNVRDAKDERIPP